MASVEDSMVFGTFGLSIVVGTILGGTTDIIFGNQPGDDYIFTETNEWLYRLNGSGGRLPPQEVANRLDYDTVSSLVIRFMFPPELMLNDAPHILTDNFRNEHVNGINIYYQNGLIKHMHRDGTIFTDSHEVYVEGDTIVKVTLEVSKEFFIPHGK